MERGLREYWVRLYVRSNYRKLGFSALEGPFDTGCDFKGVYQGKEVAVEVETSWENFVSHGHSPDKVDILIVPATEDPPEHLRGRLPKVLLRVDPLEVHQQTREDRKEYALQKQKEKEALKKFYEQEFAPFRLLAHSFSVIWSMTMCPDKDRDMCNSECGPGISFDFGRGKARQSDASCPYGWNIDFWSAARSYFKMKGIKPEHGTLTDIDVVTNSLLKGRPFDQAVLEEAQKYLSAFVRWLED